MDAGRELLCKDCKHSKVSLADWFTRPFNPYKFAKCSLYKTDDQIDPVTGQVQKGTQYYCSTARNSLSKDMCGKDAKAWEPKDPDKMLFLRLKYQR